MRPPEIESSTEEERRQYIKKTFPCIADCDMCGLCTVFKGKDPEIAYEDYISGKRSYMEVSGDYQVENICEGDKMQIGDSKGVPEQM